MESNKKVKVSKTEKKLRLNELYKQFCKGLNNNQLIQYCIDTWKLKETMSRRYIKALNEKIEKNYNASQGKYRQKAIERYDYLYQETVKEKKYKDAAIIQEKQDKITGLQIQQHKHEISQDALKELKEIFEYENQESQSTTTD